MCASLLWLLFHRLIILSSTNNTTQLSISNKGWRNRVLQYCCSSAAQETGYKPRKRIPYQVSIPNSGQDHLKQLQHLQFDDDSCPLFGSNAFMFHEDPHDRLWEGHGGRECQDRRQTHTYHRHRRARFVINIPLSVSRRGMPLNFLSYESCLTSQVFHRLSSILPFVLNKEGRML